VVDGIISHTITFACHHHFRFFLPPPPISTSVPLSTTQRPFLSPVLDPSDPFRLLSLLFTHHHSRLFVMAEITLLCLMDGTGSSFCVKVPSTGSVEDLKDKIKDKKPNDLGDVDTHRLTLWHTAIPVTPPRQISLSLPNDETSLLDLHLTEQQKAITRCYRNGAQVLLSSMDLSVEQKSSIKQCWLKEDEMANVKYLNNPRSKISDEFAIPAEGFIHVIIQRPQSGNTHCSMQA